MSSYFEFNSVKSSDMGLTIEKVRPLYSPRKRVTTHSIPGRSGDLHQWDGSYENYPIRYQCWFKKPAQYDQMAQRAHQIMEWLSTAPMGAVLRDSYDSLVYHRASYIGGAEIENTKNRFGRFTVEFDCDPRAFLDSGSHDVSKDNPIVLINPTEFASVPLLRVTGSVSGLVRIGSKSITILFPDTDVHTIYIDCELKEAWELVDGIEVSRNSYVASLDFPLIYPGQNEIAVTGGIQSAVIEPRWWTL